MAREWANDTLQTTALIHEAYLRLVDANEIEWRNRVHFFAISATVMRRSWWSSLVRVAARSVGVACGRFARGDGDTRLRPDENLVALDSALTALAAIDPRKAKVVELRFFGGFTEQEAAEALGRLLRHRPEGLEVGEALAVSGDDDAEER